MTRSQAGGSRSSLSRLSDVIAGLGSRGGTEKFVARLSQLVAVVSGCHLEGFRAVSGEWFTGPG